MLSRWLRVVLIGGATAAAVALPMAHARAASQVQVASSADGVFAQASVGFTPGSARSFLVTFVVPKGPVSGTPATGSVDLSRPWVAIKGYGADSTLACSQVANPAHFSPGGSTPGANASVWAGTYVDVACADGSGYQYYRVRWDPMPLWATVTNPLVTTWMQGQITQWDAGTLRGAVELWPNANQVATVTVCGYGSGSVRCFGGGTGNVIPSTSGLLTTAADTG